LEFTTLAAFRADRFTVLKTEIPERAMTANITLPPALLARLNTAAKASFETPDSIAALWIDAELRRARPEARATRRRNGGKAPTAKLLKPVKACSRRERLLRYFTETPGATVHGAMAEFRMTRQALFSAWTRIHFYHGIGYTFDAVNDVIHVRVPPSRRPKASIT
jgi:hypothetical protein